MARAATTSAIAVPDHAVVPGTLVAISAGVAVLVAAAATAAPAVRAYLLDVVRALRAE